MLDAFGPRNIDLSNPVSDHPLNLGLVSWWLGLPNNSGGGTLFDLVQTRRNNGTLTNGPTWIPGQRGFHGLEFTTSGSKYVDCGNPSTLQFSSSTSFTLSAYVMAYSQTNAVDQSRTVLYKQGNTNNLGYGLATSGFGELHFQFEMNKSNVVGDTLNSGVILSLNTWYHIAGVFDSSGAGQAAYVNGVLVATGTFDYSVSAADLALYIGNDLGDVTKRGFDGNINSVMVHSRALSASEIYSLYEQSLRGHPDTLRRVSSRVWSFPTPTTSVSAGPLLKLAPKVVDLGNPVSDHPLNQSLVSWWLGLPNNSGGSTLFDICQTGRNHGTLTNGPTWVPGSSGFGAISCTETSGMRVAVSATTILDITGSFTVCGWLFLRSYDDSWYESCILNQDDEASARRFRYSLGGVASGGEYGKQLWMYQPSTAARVTSNSQVPLNVWSHIGVTWDGTNYAIFLNGVTDGTGSTNITPTAGGTTSTCFGSMPSGAHPYGVDGIIDDLRIYNGRALSAGEMFGVYEQSLRGHPDTLRRVSSRVWSFGSDGGGTPATTGGYLLLLGVG